MAAAVCFGELLIDMVCDVPDASLQEAPRFLKAPGGAPANVAVGLARLGVDTGFVGQVGADPFGEWLAGILAAERVDISHLHRSATARTTIAFVATRRDGRKDICFYRNPGADAQLQPGDIKKSLLNGARVLHCGSVSLSQSPCREAQFHAVELAVEKGVLVSYDPNWRPSLWPDHAQARRTVWEMIPFSTIVKIADEEWEFVTGTHDWEEGAQRIRELGPRLVVVTRGPNGAWFNCEDGSGMVHGYSVPAIDTLGAGDSFVAGMLYQLLQASSLDDVLTVDRLREILQFANACGAIATLSPGAIPGLPTLAQVRDFQHTRRPNTTDIQID